MTTTTERGSATYPTDGEKGRPPRRLPWRWACRTVSITTAVGGIVALMAGQGAMECMAVEQASLVFAVLSLHP